MTQKEQQSIKIKTVMKAINDKFTVESEFEDIEGHGYFTGVIKYGDEVFNVDLSRRNFSVIVYEVPGSVFYKVSAEELEEALTEIIEDALQEAENKIMMLNVNKGLGIK